jgi:hypothetical protein
MFHDSIVKAWAVLTQSSHSSNTARRVHRVERRFTPQVGSNRLETRLVLSGGTVGGGIYGPPSGSTNSSPTTQYPGRNS